MKTNFASNYFSGIVSQKNSILWMSKESREPVGRASGVAGDRSQESRDSSYTVRSRHSQ